VYNALPILLYGSEIWALKKKNEKQLTSIVMNLFRKKGGMPGFEHNKNEEISEELRLEQFVKKPRQYKQIAYVI